MHHIFVVSGLINSILSWGFFKPLARINYLTYLLHVGVLQLVLYSATYSIEFTDIIAVSVTTLVVYTIKLENKMFPRCIELLLCRLRYDYLRRRLRRSPHGGVAFHRSGKTPSRRWVRQKCSFKKKFLPLCSPKKNCLQTTDLLPCRPPQSARTGCQKTRHVFTASFQEWLLPLFLLNRCFEPEAPKEGGGRGRQRSQQRFQRRKSEWRGRKKVPPGNSCRLGKFSLTFRFSVFFSAARLWRAQRVLQVRQHRRHPGPEVRRTQDIPLAKGLRFPPLSSFK